MECSQQTGPQRREGSKGLAGWGGVEVIAAGKVRVCVLVCVTAEEKVCVLVCVTAEGKV